jgi:malonate decarboxylase gamma subunit
MKLADLVAALFPAGHEVVVEAGRIHGQGPLPDGGRIQVLGVADRAEFGVDDAAWLAGQVLAGAAGQPILLMIDSGIQRMARRDELLGLNEYLAHLAKALLLAEAEGRRTVGLLFGRSAGGALIASALAAGLLAGLPGAQPEVMDLPSMSRVTKLPLADLKKMAAATPVFAPGLENYVATGAVRTVWDPARPLDRQLAELLAERAEGDRRDVLGRERGGRPKAAEIAARVFDLARAGA